VVWDHASPQPRGQLQRLEHLPGGILADEILTLGQSKSAPVRRVGDP
jgi:hypothetical protein